MADPANPNAPGQSLAPPRWFWLTLAAVALALAAYAGWWWYAAGMVRTYFADLRANGTQDGVAADYRAISVGGFPLRLRAQVTEPRLGDPRSGFEWRGEALTVQMLPWSLRHLIFELHGAQSLTLGAAGEAVAIAWRSQTGALSLISEADGAIRQADIAFTDLASAVARGPEAEPQRLSARTLALHWRRSPENGTAESGQDFDAALTGTALRVEGVALLLGPDIEDLMLDATLEGVPAVAGAPDFARWLAGGAPVRIKTLRFKSDGAGVTGEGRLGRDAAGFVSGEIALTITGLAQLNAALDRAGVIPADARAAAGMAAGLLSATGASAPVTLAFRDGRVWLGPWNLGPAPRISL